MFMNLSRRTFRPSAVATVLLMTALGCADDPPGGDTSTDTDSALRDAEVLETDTSPTTDATVRATDMLAPDQGCMPTDPPQEERCDNLDNDCDGVIDEGLERRCFDGPAGTQGRGACTDGRQVCLSGTWGACEDQVLPAAEQCSGTDEDCDGATDEGVVQDCGEAPNEGAGECTAAVQMCMDGEWGICGEPQGPVDETCDGRDNDCDGVNDEGFPDSDGDGFADCVDGDTDGDGLEAVDDNCPLDANPDQADLDGDGVGDVCDEDADGDGSNNSDDCDPLDASRAPGAQEECNGLDTDCDGQVDEALTMECFDGPPEAVGTGLCRTGVTTCSAGAWGACIGQVLPVEELCNANDDDCDGSLDETLDPGWPDRDGDTYGDDDEAPVCPRTPDLVSRPGDCDDDDPDVNSGNDDDLADDAFVDANCDGIDGVLARTMFVSEGADPELADGTQAAPFASIGEAIRAAALADYTAVGVAVGVYDEALVLIDGVSVVGGYDPADGWRRLDDRQATIRNEVPDGVILSTIWADGINEPTMITDMIIETGDHPTPNGSTYGLYAREAGALTVRRSVITAGRAGPGAPGLQGTAGENGGDAGGGGDCGGAVGTGGLSPCGQDGFEGGNGSNVRRRGEDGQPEGCGGRGGDRGRLGSGDDGSDGCRGTDGPAGMNGDGFSNSAVREDLWVTGAGAPGTAGGSGTPGGGGGGGGGAAVIGSPGGAGGGGGAGACGGGGGRGGAHGGGSFAVFAVRSPGLTIEFCELNSVGGGTGGAGGPGGVGGEGGRGGEGGNGAEAFACGGLAGPGDGGNGGEGGRGGDGGIGHAGNGGPSHALVCIAGAIETSDTVFTIGEPSAGGAGPGIAGSVGESTPTSGCD